AFVPLQLSPIYCATKAALHSYTISLRQQLKDEGVEVIELMPPAVRTDLTAGMPEDGDFKVLTTAQLMEETLKGLRAGRIEIRPGQANQLYWVSRIAPGFINAQLEKGSKSMVPPLDSH
ncbi:MAG: SDR family NAD(P)-dependent oxidoreductase, partial [Polyangiales bacterium]